MKDRINLLQKSITQLHNAKMEAIEKRFPNALQIFMETALAAFMIAVLLLIVL